MTPKSGRRRRSRPGGRLARGLGRAGGLAPCAAARRRDRPRFATCLASSLAICGGLPATRSGPWNGSKPAVPGRSGLAEGLGQPAGEPRHDRPEHHGHGRQGLAHVPEQRPRGRPRSAPPRACRPGPACCTGSATSLTSRTTSRSCELLVAAPGPAAAPPAWPPGSPLRARLARPRTPPPRSTSAATRLARLATLLARSALMRLRNSSSERSRSLTPAPRLAAKK